MAESPFDENEDFKAGLKLRREVLGAEYADGSMEKAKENPFTQPLMQFAGEVAWGKVWTRPGLSKRDRSIICLAALASLNRPKEIALHVRGALNNGMSKEEIAEIFLQIAIYAGVPASVDAFAVAKEVLEEEGVL